MMSEDRLLPELLVLFEHSEVGVVALGGDLAGIHGLLDGAARLVGVGAGGETAVVGEFEHLREVEGNLFFSRWTRPKPLRPGESMMKPPELNGYISYNDVVWRPWRWANEMLPTFGFRDGSKALMMEDFPTPDSPEKRQM